MNKNSLQESIELYKKLYLIRKAEEKIREEYGYDEMKTPMHMSMGSEAISVGVCAALAPKDEVLGTYRSHALYFAKGGDIYKFFAEIYGKGSGIIEGKGGSMHLSIPEKGFLASSAVVASTIPVSVGSAFANYYKKNGKMTAVFFGDGAIDEGAFWESFNMACLMKLPIIFICEDNGLAVHTADYKRHGYHDICDVVSKFNCSVFEDSTTDVEKILKLARRSIQTNLRFKKPSFLNLRYYRYLEHVGINEDFSFGYRQKSEFEKWFKKDPIKLQRKRLLQIGIEEKKIQNIEKKINFLIESSQKKAKKSKSPNIKSLFKNVFYENPAKN